jgi:1-acyl-sn-glycerol-3-phosphate acyltransferase
MFNRLVAVGFLVYMAVTSAVFFCVALLIWAITIAFDRRLVVLHLFTCFWACLYLWSMPPWRLSLTGREKIQRRARYVIVSNHQSHLDILVAFRLFFPFKWVSKAEVFRLPFIGWNMTLNRYIKLKRGDKISIRKMMAACERALSQGSSVFLFPEGTRSPSGELKPFKPGAFILAHQMKLPILPVVIQGTKDALPKHSLNFHGRQHFRISVLDPIPYEVYSRQSVADTTDMVRRLIADALAGRRLNAAP